MRTPLTNSNFKIGDRVGFSADFIQSVGSGPTDDLWRKHGVVIGLMGDKLVRVKFDGEEEPKAVSACNLAKPGTLRYVKD